MFYAGGAGGAVRRLGASRARGIFREGAENHARGGRAPQRTGGSVAMRFHSEVHFNRSGGNQFVSEKQICTFFEDFLFLRNKIGFGRVKNEKTYMGKGDCEAVRSSF